MKKTITYVVATSAMTAICVGSALAQWYVYDLTYEAKLRPGSENHFQKTVDFFRDRGMITPEMEPSARTKAQAQYEGWQEGFSVQGEAAVMSTGTELSHSFPGAGFPSSTLLTFYDFADGTLQKTGSRYEVLNLGRTYPTNSPLAWVVLGGALNEGFQEVSRDASSRTVVFERERGAGDAVDRLTLTFEDPQMTRWISGEEWVVYTGTEPLKRSEWTFSGEFGTPEYVATKRLFRSDGTNWRTYRFEYLRTDATGFSPASIPLGSRIIDHRTPEGQPSFVYEWNGTLADVSQHAGGGFPVVGWYVLSALGFTALGVYLWRKR